MRASLLVTAILLFILIAAACGKDSSREAKRSPGELYQRNCATCHAMNGEGTTIGMMRVPSLKREDAVKQTDEQLFNWIQEGSSNMPPFKNRLTEEEIRELVRFIREEIQAQAPRK